MYTIVLLTLSKFRRAIFTGPRSATGLRRDAPLERSHLSPLSQKGRLQTSQGIDSLLQNHL